MTNPHTPSRIEERQAQGRPEAAQELAAYSFGGSTMTMLVPGSATDGAFALVHIRKAAGSSTPTHAHDDETEISYVLAGAMAVQTPAGVTRLDVDEWHVLPPPGAHRLFNDSSSEMQELLVCVPAIFDRFVATAGRPVEPFAAPEGMTDEARQRLTRHAPDFDIRLFRAMPEESPSPAHAAAAPETVDALGGRVEVLAALGDQDDAIAFLRLTLPAGGTLPQTTFADRQALYLIKGALDLQREGTAWQALTRQAAANLAPGARVALRTVGDDAATVLVVSTVRTLRLLRSQAA